MPEIQKYSLIEELKKADENLMGSPSLLGMTMLGFPGYVNSMRSTMFTSHLKQFLNLLEPEFPFLFTNNENIVGKYSSGYRKAEHDLVVVKKIGKYEDILDSPRIYKLFTFDKVTETFDVIERKVCESLTENFGYDYVNDRIDEIKEGDELVEGEIIYHSTSYDEDMNYGYGRNAVVMYTLDPYTSEDAAIISKSFSKKMSSIEADEIKIGLNANDYLINLYGDDDEYKPLPDIGEMVDGKLAVSRRQFNNQLLFDFKDTSLHEIHDGDTVFYVDDNVEIIDYTIYNNQDEDVDNPFYDQINKYLYSEIRYYEAIKETCDEIMHSGKKYTRDVEYAYKRASHMLDRKKKWKESNDSVFGNMEIEVSIRRVVPLGIAGKFTGRSGNKSVVSAVWDDEDMPYTKDGRRCDVMLNLLALINRTTSLPLFEIFVNGSAYQTRQLMKTLPTFKEKEEMLFKFIRIWNDTEATEMYDDYKTRTKKGKEEYIQDAIDNGIYIHQDAMWESRPFFYRCMDLLKEFGFIRTNEVYIKRWGREYKMLSSYFIGEQFLLKLKQTAKRGFSARSTGALDTKSLPTRSFKSKSHMERISSSCIRFGELRYVYLYLFLDKRYTKLHY